MSESLDGTRDRLAIESLDDKTRKNLLKKFQDGGGKIVQDTKASADETADGAHTLNDEPHSPRHRIEVVGDEDNSWERRRRRRDEKYLGSRHRSADLMERIKINIRAMMNKVVVLFRPRYVHPAFWEFFKHDAAPAMADLEILIMNITMSTIGARQLIQEALSGKKVYYYDLLEKFNNLYNIDENNALLKEWDAHPHTPIPIRAVEENIKVLYKRLSVIHTFKESAYLTLQIAINTYAAVTNLSHREINQMQRRARYDLDIIYGKLIDKVYHLICVIRQLWDEPGSWALYKFVNVGAQDKVGVRDQEAINTAFDNKLKHLQEEEGMIPPEESEQDTTDTHDEDTALHEDTDTDTIPEIDEEIFKGLRLHKMMPIEELRQDLSRTGIKHCKNSDKLAYLFFLVKEFEKEYSFILTSSAIKINPAFTNNKKINYKDKMNMLYSSIRIFNALFEEYFMVMKDWNDINGDQVMGEVERYHRLQGIAKRRKNAAYGARKQVWNFFETLTGYLRIFIKDYNTTKKLIETPDEILRFNVDIEGKKKVHGKTIIEAIRQAYYFCSTVLFRLGDDGDLGGFKFNWDDDDGPMTDRLDSLQSARTVETMPKPPAASNTAAAETEKETKLVHELDDLIQ